MAAPDDVLAAPSPDDRCPCGRGRAFGACCGRLLAGDAQAGTPEDLMRSRYSAFAVGDAAYLLRTWAPETRPSRVRIDPAMRWTGLEVLAADGGLLDAEGTVEFVATYVRPDGPGALHERSRFRRDEGRWTYVDGDQLG
ncbi:MAG: YchJ family metal-binding protein [Acidimicrobiales bacterium]